MTLADIKALLFVPAGRERFIASAIKHRPDAVILDLEDALAPSEKPQARAALRSQQAQLAASGIATVVRVNSGLRDMVDDIAAIDADQTLAVMVAKCQDARPLENATELLTEAERATAAKPVPLIALIEQPSALAHLPAIAGLPRLAAMMFGPEDYAAELGVPPTSPALEWTAAQLTAACTRRSLLPIGIAGPMGNFKDRDAYLALVQRAKLLGFRAAAAIHPDQLATIRTGFLPTAQEIDKARVIVARFDQATAAGEGAIALAGSMIDLPVVIQARRVLAAAARGPAAA